MKISNRTRNGLWAVFLVLLTAFATSYFNGVFSKKEDTLSITAKDSATVVAPTITGNDVKENINVAAGDITTKKVEVKDGGTAFFDSSKQVNNYSNAIVQRHLDQNLIKKMVDSIPSKETKITIYAGGGKEGENLATEYLNYFKKKGYQNIDIQTTFLDGYYDQIMYQVLQNDFIITIFPRPNIL